MTPEFKHALARSKKTVYQWMWAMTSTVCIVLQVAATALADWSSFPPQLWAPVVLIAYILADLASGAVHMVADNITVYTGFFGPLVADFHQHHHREYQRRRLASVYFREARTKLWLLPFWVVAVITAALSHPIAPALVLFGVFSHIAEISHYAAHTSGLGRPIRLLQRCGLLLRPEHHLQHHTQDNRNYAFLCGWTDGLLNAVAAWLKLGYKGRADQDSVPD